MPVFNHLTEREFIPADAVVIQRPSRWGNPFVIGRDGNREDVLGKHRAWLWDEIKVGRIALTDLVALDGAALLCCCAPMPYHGETLLAAAEWAARQFAAYREKTMGGTERIDVDASQPAILIVGEEKR